MKLINKSKEEVISRFNFRKAKSWEVDQKERNIKRHFEVARLDPNSNFTKNFLTIAAMDLAEIGRIEEAAFHLKDLRMQNPRNPVYNYNYGVTLIELGKFSEAAKVLKIAARVDKMFYPTWISTGIALLDIGDIEEASRVFQDAVTEIDPDDSNAWIYLGLTSLYSEEFLKASEQFKQGASLSSTPQQTLHQIGVFLLQKLRPNDAITLLKKAIEYSEIYASGLIGIVTVLLKSNPKKAEEILRNIVEMKNINKTEAYTQLGNILFHEDPEQALECFEKALESNSSYFPALFQAGLVLFNLRKYEQAIEKYKHVTKIDPVNVEAIFQWGIMLNQLGRLEESKEKIEKAIKLNTAYKKRYEHLNTIGLFKYDIEYFEELIEHECEVCKKITKHKFNEDDLAYCFVCGHLSEVTKLKYYSNVNK
ncbi:MAG: tetratricopeptide repeat protein [Promethearchaeota archaeon]